MMWTEDKPSFKGKHYVIEEPLCEPKPVQKPHPPITIGGSGEKYTLKVVAAFADRWNYIGDINQYKQKLSALEKHCKKIGIDLNDIDKTYHTSMEIYTDENEFLQDMKKIYESGYYGRRPIEETSFDEWLVRFQSRAIVGKSETCLERIKEMIDLGITYFIFSARGLALRRAPDLKRRNASLQRFADEVISQIYIF